MRRFGYTLATSQAGKVALVTGANTGIGRVTAVELARHGAHVILVCRSLATTPPVLDEIAAVAPPGTPPAECWEAELGSLASTKQVAERFLASGLPLHLLINNAGFAGEQPVTADGLEPLFQVNYLSHFVLTVMLLPVIKRTPGARIVNVSSVGHMNARRLDWSKLIGRADTTTTGVMARYFDSKFCQVASTLYLQRRLAGTGVEVYALHPGGVASDVWRSLNWFLQWVIRMVMVSVEQGARTTLMCATAPGLQPGGYYSECLLTEPNMLAKDEKLQDELWQRSLELAKLSVNEAELFASV